jgi:hypothetical protein
MEYGDVWVDRHGVRADKPHAKKNRIMQTINSACFLTMLEKIQQINNAHREENGRRKPEISDTTRPAAIEINGSNNGRS